MKIVRKNGIVTWINFSQFVFLTYKPENNVIVNQAVDGKCGEWERADDPEFFDAVVAFINNAIPIEP